MTNANPYAPSPDISTNASAKFTAQPISQQAPAHTPNPLKKRSYSLTESIFAWLSLLSGYIFCRVFPVAESPFGGFIFIVLLFLVSSIVLKIKNKKITLLPTVVAISAILISASLILCSNAFLYFFAYSYSLIAYCYFIFASCGNSVKNGFSDFIIVDFFKALIIMPFPSFGAMFKSMFSRHSNCSNKIVLKIVIGIAVAVVPTFIVISLLSYDSIFSQILDNVFSFDISDVFSHIGSLTLGVPIGLYMYGLFISSVDNKCKNVLSEQACKKACYKLKFAPSVTVIVAVIPLLFVYVIFFISQWQYYISGFTGILPDNFSYAEYAREGFFQLCTVSIINLILISAVLIFMKRNTKLETIILKTVTVIFTVVTLILITTAIAKMFMYINYYGLTQKRVYATWLMVIIALVFIILTLHRFIKKIKPLALTFAIVVVLFASLLLPNTDAFIAKYNVGRYLDGTLSTVDVNAMDELGSSAIPSLVELIKVLDEEQGRDILTWENHSGRINPLYRSVANKLYSEAELIAQSERDIFSFNIPDALAEKALKDIGIID